MSELPYRNVGNVDRAGVQSVNMNLYPGESVPREVHETIRQIVTVYKGWAVIEIDGVKRVYGPEGRAVIERGREHVIWNVSDELLQLDVLYNPAKHPDGLLQWEPDAPTKKKELDEALLFFTKNGPDAEVVRMMGKAVFCDEE